MWIKQPHRYCKFCILWKGRAWWAGDPANDRQNSTKIPSLGNCSENRQVSCLFSPRHTPPSVEFNVAEDSGIPMRLYLQRSKPDLVSPWLSVCVSFLLFSHVHILL